MDELILLPDTESSIQSLGVEHQAAARAFVQFYRDKDAYSPNTLKSLRLTMTSWVKWCRARGIDWFPVAPDTVRAYLLSLSDSGMASTSITRHLAMLNMMLVQCGQPSMAGNQVVGLAMKKIRRDAVTAKGERTGQAVPMRLADAKLIDVLLLRTGRLVDLRNRAFLYMAYNTLLRMAEMSRIRVRDLETTGDTVTLHVGHTKTSATAAGIDKILSRRTVSALNDWLDASGLRDHPDMVLFPPVHRSNKARFTETPLTAPALEKIFSDAWSLLDKKDIAMNKGRYATWTGHSARVGAALDMSESGVPLSEIMREGGWKKAETLMRYLRSSSMSVGANSKLMDL
ncbi:tyrosine-type recombinase/integrase [Klebsiella michiganensis]|nr:tyrosine-type recombinase/integrase [Klebsiella michiganensis]